MSNIIVTDLGVVSGGTADLTPILTRLNNLDGVDSGTGFVNQLEDRIEDLENAAEDTSASTDVLAKIEAATGVKFATFTSGAYDLRNSVAAVDDASYKRAVVQCSGTSVIHIKANGGSPYGTYRFADSNNTLLSTINTATLNGSTVIAVPTGATKLYVNTKATYADPFIAVGEYMMNDLESIKTKINNLILLQSSTPDTDQNVLWIHSDQNNYTAVPTMDDMTAAIQEAKDDISTDIDDVIDYIREDVVPTIISDTVRYGEQTLSPADQEQARTNIGAASPATVTLSSGEDYFLTLG